MLKHINKKHTFIDVGCGTGIYTNMLCDVFDVTYGVDPSQSMIDNKIHNDQITYLCNYLHNVNVTNVDLITCFTCVPNHMNNNELE